MRGDVCDAWCMDLVYLGPLITEPDRSCARYRVSSSLDTNACLFIALAGYDWRYAMSTLVLQALLHLLLRGLWPTAVEAYVAGAWLPPGLFSLVLRE